MKIGILGNGFVGKATRILENPECQIMIYDIRPEACVPLGITLQEINDTADLLFLCLPTPMHLDGACDTSILDSVIASLTHPLIVVRSTVPVGFTDARRCFFMPEFLTEKNWAQDFRENPLWIFGMSSSSTHHHGLFRQRIESLLDSASRHGKILSAKTKFMTNKEAEMVKLFKNVFLASKVSFCNEMYDICQRGGIDYDAVRAAVAEDERIGRSHLAVPGYGGRRGFGGTCFPKDINSLYRLFCQHAIPAPILGAVLHRNEYQDNREREWLGDVGRTFHSSYDEILLVVGEEADADILSHLEASPLNIVLHIAHHPIAANTNPQYFFTRAEASHPSPLFYPHVHRILFVCEDSIPRCQLLLRVLELQQLHSASLTLRNQDCGPLVSAFVDKLMLDDHVIFL